MVEFQKTGCLMDLDGTLIDSMLCIIAAGARR